MALRWTHHLTNMNTKVVFLEVKAAVRGADSLTTFMCLLFRSSGSLSLDLRRDCFDLALLNTSLNL